MSTTATDFGGVYVHYTDVSKAVEELAVTEDAYHYDIVPYLHYSADFSIKFNDTDGVEQQRLEQLYKDNNSDILGCCGYKHNDPRLTAGSIKLAQLEYDSKHAVLVELAKYNNVLDVVIR